MFEHRSDQLLPSRAYRRRLIRHIGYAVIVLVASLLVGTLGFWALAGQEPLTALLNSAMLLGGMGPVGEIQHTSGKLFASAFALYAGLAFIGIAGLLFAPAFHRILHKFHLEEREPRKKPPR